MATNLYSVTPFRSIENTVINETPILTIQLGSYGTPEHKAKIESLREGESYVIAQATQGIRILSGWRITRLPDYRTNRICFDEHAKEYVLVSNGRCVLDHSSPEAFKASHNGHECEYAPSEAIALRVFVDNGKATCAWTHRAVNPCNLRPVTNEAEIKAQFEAVLSHKRTSRFIGRI